MSQQKKSKIGRKQHGTETKKPKKRKRNRIKKHKEFQGLGEKQLKVEPGKKDNQRGRRRWDKKP